MNVKLNADYHKDVVTYNGYTISKSQISHIPDKHFNKLQKKINGLIIIKENKELKVEEPTVETVEEIRPWTEDEISKMTKKQLFENFDGDDIKSSMTKSEIIETILSRED